MQIDCRAITFPLHVVVPKRRIIAVMSVFYFRSNIFYINELWPINRPGNLRDDLRWPPQHLEDVGHQALVFFLGLWNLSHGVRLAGGRPGYCLVGDSLWGAWFWYNFFWFSTLQGYIFRTHVQYGQLAVLPRTMCFRSFRWLLISTL